MGICTKPCLEPETPTPSVRCIMMAFGKLGQVASGTSSTILVRQVVSSDASHQHLSRSSCTPSVRAMWCPWDVVRAAWSLLKRFQAPGKASNIDQSSPITFLHFCRDVWCCVGGMESRIL